MKKKERITEAQDTIHTNLLKIQALLTECKKIAEEERLSFVPISALFNKEDAVDAFGGYGWESSEVCW